MFADLEKNIISFFMDTVQARFFKLRIIITFLGWGLPIHTRFDDHDLVSRSQVHQNHKLQL